MAAGLIDQDKDSSPAALPMRLVAPSLLLMLFLAAVAGAGVWSSHGLSLSDYFFLNQDIGPLAVIVIFLFALRIISLPERSFDRWPAVAAPGAAAALALFVGAAGCFLVFKQYPLSIDEFWATFDAEIFRHGKILARVPIAWRPYVPALQPMWRLETKGDAFWGSTYLPLNAAARAIFATVGLQAFASPAFAALGCVATYGVARRLWPQRADAANVAVVLLATSPQLLVTAMTPYAMSAHFGLDMVWLWLFTRDRWWAFTASVIVGLAACGLHQLVFHLLFAGPFILELWLARRWRAAASITIAYGAIVVFWLSWWSIQLALAGAQAAMVSGAGAPYFLQRLASLASRMEPRAPIYMAENLVRFVTWQNPLLVPLAIIGGLQVRRSPAELRPLLLGVGSTLAVTYALIPYQGHGWGYRYLHGLLGSVALLSAAGWIRLSSTASLPKGRGATVMAASSLFALGVLLPWRAHQAEAFTRPYASAYKAIVGDPADVVLVDPTGLLFGVDLVRNDPFLHSGPKVMLLSSLKADQVRALCAGATVSVFDAARGAAFNMKTTSEQPLQPLQRLRTLIKSSGCRSSGAERISTGR